MDGWMGGWMDGWMDEFDGKTTTATIYALNIFVSVKQS